MWLVQQLAKLYTVKLGVIGSDPIPFAGSFGGAVR